jgi:hypothetical protein
MQWIKEPLDGELEKDDETTVIGFIKHNDGENNIGIGYYNLAKNLQSGEMVCYKPPLELEMEEFEGFINDLYVRLKVSLEEYKNNYGEE